MLSSSWRWDKKADKRLREQLKVFNLEIYDTTILDAEVTLTRTAEIKNYLENNPNIKNYVILDDSEIEKPFSSHWIKCLFKNGLTRKLAEQAIEILKGDLND